MSVIVLKEKVDNVFEGKVYDIDLVYLILRGYWYYISWKGDILKFGGIVINIGVYFYDML